MASTLRFASVDLGGPPGTRTPNLWSARGPAACGRMRGRTARGGRLRSRSARSVAVLRCCTAAPRSNLLTCALRVRSGPAVHMVVVLVEQPWMSVVVRRLGCLVGCFDGTPVGPELIACSSRQSRDGVKPSGGDDVGTPWRTDRDAARGCGWCGLRRKAGTCHFRAGRFPYVRLTAFWFSG